MKASQAQGNHIPAPEHHPLIIMELACKASGSGFFISKANVLSLVQSDCRLDFVDDIMAGHTLKRHGVEPEGIERIDFAEPQTEILKGDHTPQVSDISHFRNKCHDGNTDAQRMYQLYARNFDPKQLLDEN